MQLQITRLPSEERKYLVVTGAGKQYGVDDSVLRRWLLSLGVEESTVDAVLRIEPTQTTTIRAEKAA